MSGSEFFEIINRSLSHYRLGRESAFLSLVLIGRSAAMISQKKFSPKICLKELYEVHSVNCFFWEIAIRENAMGQIAIRDLIMAPEM